MRRHIRDELGLTEFLHRAGEGWEWTRDDLADIAGKARSFAPAIKAHLNFTVTDEMSDTQVVHQLLAQMGIKTQFRWSNLHPEHLGEKIRVYSLNRDHWEMCLEILDLRLEKRQSLQDERGEREGSPLPLSIPIAVGDPGAIAPTKGHGGISGLFPSGGQENAADTRSFEQGDLGTAAG